MIDFELVTIDWGAVGAISTIVIAILGFSINSRLKRQEKERERYSLLVEYRRELNAFSIRFFDIVADLSAYSANIPCNDEDRSRIRNLVERLSSLIDEGRFLFPNDAEAPNNYGKEKGPAYEGARRPALDALMAAYLVGQSLIQDSESKDLMSTANRELVKTGQPISATHRPQSVQSILIESRRCYVNAIFPSTLPREWQKWFHEILGPVPKGKE